jgi:hypothetical protein
MESDSEGRMTEDDGMESDDDDDAIGEVFSIHCPAVCDPGKASNNSD